MSDLIAGYARHMRAAALAQNTIRDRTEFLRRIDDALPMGLERATTEELADWLAGADDTEWCAQTKSTYHGHVCGFFRWACDPRNPQLDFDPTAGLSRPRVPRRKPRPVSDEELEYVLTNTTGLWQFAATCAAYAGLRACEVATVRKEDITEETITLVGKGNKDEIIPTHPLIWRAVRDFPPGRLSTHIKGREVDAQYVSIQFGAHMRRRHGRPGLTLHRLRHWFGTNLLRLGADLRTVQELMRHADPATTAVYTLITDRQRRTAIRALPGFTTPDPS